jgi:hypothetical protein
MSDPEDLNEINKRSDIPHNLVLLYCNYIKKEFKKEILKRQNEANTKAVTVILSSIHFLNANELFYT